jgi:hypothetical protein
MIAEGKETGNLTVGKSKNARKAYIVIAKFDPTPEELESFRLL